MSAKTESLRDLYVDITGEETVTEPQQETPSHDTVEGQAADLQRELSAVTRGDGLGDAVDQPSRAN
jgi:hypothetical protein